MKNDKLRREAKNEIPVIETNDPYIAWNPITGTSRIVLIRKPRPQLRVGTDVWQSLIFPFAHSIMFFAIRHERSAEMRHTRQSDSVEVVNHNMV